MPQLRHYAMPQPRHYATAAYAAVLLASFTQPPQIRRAASYHADGPIEFIFMMPPQEMMWLPPRWRHCDAAAPLRYDAASWPMLP